MWTTSRTSWKDSSGCCDPCAKNGTWLSQKAANQYKKSFVSRGKRGKIYDTNLREMAVSIDVTSIAAYPLRVKDTKETAKALGGIIKIDRKEITRKRVETDLLCAKSRPSDKSK